jgi:hypothetical protein
MSTLAVGLRRAKQMNTSIPELAAEIKAGRITRRDAQLVQQAAKESKLVRSAKSLPIEHC